MIKVLINAYACSPHTGSEPGMAWNWCVHLAKHCKLYIITEGEFKEYIDNSLKDLPQASNMNFYYNPVTDEIREMCWNQGDWRFYKHYKKWQFKTYELALEIIKKENVDIVHQLNMIGFREPGYLWKIEELPFVWGPIGGLKQMPISYLKGAGFKMNLMNRLKNTINILQLKYDKRVNQALKKSELLISSIPDSYKALKKYKNLDSIIIPETGCFLNSGTNIDTERFERDCFDVLWVGKFDFRKQLPLALRSLSETKNKKIVLNVYGSGTLEEVERFKELAIELNIDSQVVWHGNQSNSIVLEKMKEAQLFFFTSISEDTSTVVLEAISNQLPVLCFDACGFGAVIDELVGCKVELSNPINSINDFSSKLNYLENNRQILKEMSINCKERQEELSWVAKALKMKDLYESILN